MLFLLNLPLTFKMDMVFYLNTIQMINFLIAIERKSKPEYIRQTAHYSLLFNQK